MTPGELNHIASHLGFALSGLACVVAAARIIPRFAAVRRVGTWRFALTSQDRNTLIAAVIFAVVGIFPFAVLLFVVKILLDRSPSLTKRPKLVRKAPLFPPADPVAYEYYQDGRPQGGGWGIHSD